MVEQKNSVVYIKTPEMERGSMYYACHFDRQRALSKTLQLVRLCDYMTPLCYKYTSWTRCSYVHSNAMCITKTQVHNARRFALMQTKRSKAWRMHRRRYSNCVHVYWRKGRVARACCSAQLPEQQKLANGIIPLVYQQHRDHTHIIHDHQA